VLERGNDAGWAASARRSGGTLVAGLKADGPLCIGHVEIAHVIDAGTRDGVEDTERQVAVRIDHGDTFPARMSPWRG